MPCPRDALSAATFPVSGEGMSAAGCRPDACPDRSLACARSFSWKCSECDRARAGDDEGTWVGPLLNGEGDRGSVPLGLPRRWLRSNAAAWRGPPCKADRLDIPGGGGGGVARAGRDFMAETDLPDSDTWVPARTRSRFMAGAAAERWVLKAASGDCTADGVARSVDARAITTPQAGQANTTADGGGASLEEHPGQATTTFAADVGDADGRANRPEAEAGAAPLAAAAAAAAPLAAAAAGAPLAAPAAPPPAIAPPVTAGAKPVAPREEVPCEPKIGRGGAGGAGRASPEPTGAAARRRAAIAPVSATVEDPGAGLERAEGARGAA